MGFVVIGRVLIYVLLMIVWYHMNKKLDQLDTKEEELKAHKTWGKFFWLYGWLIGTRKVGVVIRYILTGILAFLLSRWFFIVTSTTPK